MLLYGYKLINGDILIDEEKANIVKQIFTDYINKIAPEKIALQLTEKGITSQIGLAIWNHNAIRKMLEEKSYLGDENYPPLLDEITFTAAQKRRQLKKPNQRKVTGEKGVYPLSGKLVCGICNRNYNFAYVQQDGSKTWVCHGNSNSKNDNGKCKMRIKETFVFEPLNKVLKSIQTKNKIFTTKPNCYSPKKSREYNLLNFQIRQALRDEEYNAKELIGQIFERTQKEYDGIIIDDFSERTEALLPIINTYDGTEENTANIVNQAIDRIVINDNKIKFTFKNLVSVDMEF